MAFPCFHGVFLRKYLSTPWCGHGAVLCLLYIQYNTNYTTTLHPESLPSASKGFIGRGVAWLEKGLKRAALRHLLYCCVCLVCLACLALLPPSLQSSFLSSRDRHCSVFERSLGLCRLWLGKHHDDESADIWYVMRTCVTGYL